MSNDNVNHPKHYTSHPSGIECIEVTRHMGFNLGNAMKYIWRADLKHDAIEDLKKAVWYINDEIEKRTKGERQMSYRRLTEADKELARRWKLQGISHSRIARHIGCCQETITSFLVAEGLHKKVYCQKTHSGKGEPNSEQDYEPDKPAQMPCPYPRGSQEQLDWLRDRASNREDLRHAADNPDAVGGRNEWGDGEGSIRVVAPVLDGRVMRGRIDR
jgi:Protein of unknwon function (DUF3310)